METQKRTFCGTTVGVKKVREGGREEGGGWRMEGEGGREGGGGWRMEGEGGGRGEGGREGGWEREDGEQGGRKEERKEETVGGKEGASYCVLIL